MDVHLLDGTYELFRHFFAVPRRLDAEGRECGAVVGVVGSVLRMLEDGCTHLGVATDHVIESFRNELWPGYKTGAGVDPALRGQFEPLERALAALGVVVWPMVEFEADDALASAASFAARDRAVTRVWICTPDKDLGQCVDGDRVVQLDRRTRAVRDANGVLAKFGVPPASIPDYLALVGDSADGFPGLRGWGARSTAAVLARFAHLDAIPRDPVAWVEQGVRLPQADALARTLVAGWESALLFRDLATLRAHLALFDHVEALRWTGPVSVFEAWCAAVSAPELLRRAQALADARR